MRTRRISAIGGNRRLAGPAGGNTAPVALPLTSGIVAYYALNNNGNDSSPNARNMTLAGATYGTGILLQDLVTANTDTAAYVATLAACSVSMWFWFDPTSAAHLAQAGFKNGGTSQFLITGNRITATASVTVGGVGSTTIASSVTTGAWHHAVCTSDGGGVIRTYFDGAFVTNITGTTAGLATDTLFLGANIRSFLDEVGFWSRELTPANVASLYNGGVGKNPYI